jgi:hypothetical protein
MLIYFGHETLLSMGFVTLLGFWSLVKSGTHIGGCGGRGGCAWCLGNRATVDFTWIPLNGK